MKDHFVGLPILRRIAIRRGNRQIDVGFGGDLDTCNSHRAKRRPPESRGGGREAQHFVDKIRNVRRMAAQLSVEFRVDEQVLHGVANELIEHIPGNRDKSSQIFDFGPGELRVGSYFGEERTMSAARSAQQGLPE